MPPRRRCQKVAFKSVSLFCGKSARDIFSYELLLSLEQQTEEPVVIEVCLFKIPAIVRVEMAKQVANDEFFVVLVHLSWPFNGPGVLAR